MRTFQVESFIQQLPELKPLLPLHYDQLALDKDKVPLDPQYQEYFKRELADSLLFVTMRIDGALRGYFIGFIAPGLHYQTCLTCHMDIFFIHPENRNGSAGSRLFQAVEQELVRRGVQRWFVGSKIHADCSALFERRGFGLVEKTYSKWIGPR